MFFPPPPIPQLAYELERTNMYRAPATPPGETCEQRRAREYGIDTPASTTATGGSPLSDWEEKVRDTKRNLDPEPNPRDYIDPIVYALHHADWVRRQG